jgi:hypothetical protein
VALSTTNQSINQSIFSSVLLFIFLLAIVLSIRRFILLLDYHWYLQTFLTFIEIGKPGEKQSNVNVIVEWEVNLPQ